MALPPDNRLQRSSLPEDTYIQDYTHTNTNNCYKTKTIYITTTLQNKMHLTAQNYWLHVWLKAVKVYILYTSLVQVAIIINK